MKKANEIISLLKDQKIMLWLEHGQLKFRAPQGAMTADLKSLLSDKKADIIAFLQQTGTEVSAKLSRIARLPEQAYYELSHGQKRLMILDQLETGITTHNMFTAHRIKGKLDTAVLEAVFMKVIDRHEMLRTAFIMMDNGPVQQILPAGDINFHILYKDFRELADYMPSVSDLAREELITRFNLSAPPLFRATLIQTADIEHIFFLTLHHIISDGWSQEVLLRDIIQLYNAGTGQAEALPEPLPIQYKDYAAWMNGLLGSEEIKPYEQYWTTLFSTPPPVLNLPLDFPRARIKQHLGMSHTFHIKGPMVSEIRQLCRQYNCTMFTFFFAILKTVLYRYTGEQDITVGTPVAARPHPDLEGQIGFYVNTLAFRTRLTDETTFLQLMDMLIRQTDHAFKFQLYPFNMLVEKLAVKRDVSRHPLFDLLYTYENAKDRKKEMNMPGMAIEAVPFGHCMDKFDFEFTVIEEDDDDLECYINFNTTLFRKETAVRLGAHIAYVTEHALKNPQCLLADIPLSREAAAVRYPDVLPDEEDVLFDFS